MLVDVGLCSFTASRDFHLTRRGRENPCWSWAAFVPNGTRDTSTSNPAELGALFPLLSRVSKLPTGMKLISLTYNPRTQRPKNNQLRKQNHEHNTHQSKTEQPFEVLMIYGFADSSKFLTRSKHLNTPTISSTV